MSQENEIPDYLASLKEAPDQTAEKIWDQYFPRLVGLARSILKANLRHDHDPEDVAISALKSFYFRARDGRFPELRDNEGLWKLLMTITVRKAFRVHRRNKRYSDKDVFEWLQQLPNREITAEDAVAATDEIDLLLDLLPDERTRQIVVTRLEGYTQKEIAERVDCSIATVERKLRLVREIWSERLNSE